MRSVSNKGFTLIELLIVIAIIGVLSAIVLVSLNTSRERGVTAGIQRSFVEARTQAELFYVANGGRYTASVNDTSATNMCNSVALADGTKGVYSMLEDAANVSGVPSGNIRTCTGSGCAGANNFVTCHSCPVNNGSGNCSGLNSNGWAIEAPLKDNQGGSAQDFWCIDSSGSNARFNDGSRLAVGDVLCQ